MNIEEIIAQAAKEILREQIVVAMGKEGDKSTYLEEVEVEVTQPSAQALTSSAKSGS